jgi:rhodanese-related sulfurtransferase
MKWSVFFIVTLIILLPPSLLFSVTQSANSYVNVNVPEAKQMIGSNPNLVILDVRTQTEYDEGHIENAVLIPVSELEGRLDELNSEKDTLVYCRSGVRSATASQILVDNGFSSVYNMLGGMLAWRDAGYWIEIIHEGDLIIDTLEIQRKC